MLNDILYSIDVNTMVLGLLFVIFFAVINFALGRTLKDRGTSSIVAFCVALLAVYGINRTSLDLSGLFTSWGLGDKFWYTIVPILILIGLIFMIWKLKFPKTLTLVGAAFIVMSFIPDFIYEKSIVFIIGIVLFVIGIILWMGSRKRISNLRNTKNPQ